MCIFISIYQELFNKEDSIINPILQMRKLRHRAVIYPGSKVPNTTFHHFCRRRSHHRHLCSCMFCLRAVAEAALRTNPKQPQHGAQEGWACLDTSTLPEDGLASKGPCHMQVLTVLLQHSLQEDRGGPQSSPGPSYQGHTERSCQLHFQKQCISVGRTCSRLIKALPITSLALCHPDMTRLLWATRAATTCCSSHRQGMPGGAQKDI